MCSAELQVYSQIDFVAKVKKTRYLNLNFGYDSIVLTVFCLQDKALRKTSIVAPDAFDLKKEQQMNMQSIGMFVRVPITT